MLKRIAAVFAALLPRGLWPSPRLGESERARMMSAARAEDLEGMPALYLSGSHYEMGYQHGTLAREGIRAFRSDAYAYMTDLIRQAMKWPAWLARLLAVSRIKTKMPSDKPFIFRTHHRSVFHLEFFWFSNMNFANSIHRFNGNHIFPSFGTKTTCIHR